MKCRGKARGIKSRQGHRALAGANQIGNTTGADGRSMPLPSDHASFHGVSVCGINDMLARVTLGLYMPRYGMPSPYENTAAS
jgi:hypothetical protein